jgi:CRISPR-associated protein Cas1
LSIKNGSQETLISLDDIDIVMVENQQTTITSALLSHLANTNISVVFVDEKFTPSAISIGLYKNSRTTKIQRAQIAITKPKRNRLWRDIIYAKVLHQALLLEKIRGDNTLHFLLKKITSGDKTNIESVAASFYFKTLFEDDFHRKSVEDSRNIALNYGYSILRSALARYIVAYGLNPSFGMWHSSELNGFNLADDLIEPFRPIVDSYVVAQIQKKSEVTFEYRKALVGLLYSEVKNSKGEKVSVNNALEHIVSSYQSFCLGKREDIEIFQIDL